MKPVAIGTEIESKHKVLMDVATLMKSRLLIQASSGGGKSYCVRKLIEKTHGQVQQVILDIEDEFSTLREKYDFVLVGKGGDIPADPRSAELLAHKILELRADVIVNLYELKQHERIRFVKLFLDAMVNAPKELWHHCLIVLDEAHQFAPEKSKSESLSAVIDMETRGRKRGFCLVPATQRLSKLHKDVAAECQNKLIGLANLDIDRKRAAEELGFSERQQILTLRDIEPGEFWAVGPAFARGVNKIKIGKVETTHHEAGSVSNSTKKPVATGKVKSILAKLTDLPKEAEEELRTKQDMMAKIKKLEHELRQAQKNTKTEMQIREVKILDPKAIKRVALAEVKDFKRHIVKETSKAMSQFQQALMSCFDKEDLMKAMMEKPVHSQEPSTLKRGVMLYSPPTPVKLIKRDIAAKSSLPAAQADGTLGRCERAILKFLAMREGASFTKTQVGVMTQYSPTSGGFNNALSKLSSQGLIVRERDNIQINPEAVPQVRDILGNEYTAPEPNARIGWLQKLGKCERVIFEHLNHHEDEPFTKDQLGQVTNYSPTSGGFNNALSKLSTLGLIDRRSDGTIRLNPEIVGL